MNQIGYGRTFVPWTEWEKQGVLHARTDREDGAEGKLIKDHQRELACGRDKIKVCCPFGPCRPLSALPALRSQDHCTARVHGWCWNTMHTHTHTQSTPQLYLSFLKFFCQWAFADESGTPLLEARGSSRWLSLITPSWIWLPLFLICQSGSRLKVDSNLSLVFVSLVVIFLQ